MKKTKHDLLMAEETVTYQPSPEIIRYIETSRAERHQSIDGLRVLDWGTGHGQLVAFLRDLSAECFGVDPDESSIGQAQNCFTSRGWQSERVLRPILEDNRMVFRTSFSTW